MQRRLHEEAAIIRWLSLRRGGRVNLVVPRRGEKLKLMKLLERNAYMMLKQERGEEKAKALLQLKAYLSLEEKPLRIEGFDISNIHGRYPTGSVVVFEEGKREKSEYRRFKIKKVEGIDDFAMLSEVVDRRYRRIIKEKGNLPHLILVDGGKGQVSSCLRVLKSLGLDDLPLIGLAKELEEVYLPGKSLPLDIPQNSAALKLLQEIRDEAHRFAHTFHIQSRKKRLKASSLDEIPGIGRETRKLLLTYFKSVNQIRNKSWRKLAEIPGIGEKRARKILDYLSSKIDSPSC
ncbi:UvrABC system protein C [subsurface metagenome]